VTNNLFKALGATTLLAVLLAAAGCTNKSDPDTIDRRSVERWNYLIAHQAEKAYDYLTPGFRQTQTRENYAAAMNSRPVQWKAVKFNKKECDADRCKVTVDVTYAVTLGGGAVADMTSSRQETWLLVDGEWFLLPSI
jgi:hypothetical protein